MDRDDRVGSFVLGVLSALGLVWVGQNVIGALFALFLLAAGVLGLVWLFAFAALKWAVMALAVYALFVLVVRGARRAPSR